MTFFTHSVCRVLLVVWFLAAPVAHGAEFLAAELAQLTAAVPAEASAYDQEAATSVEQAAAKLESQAAVEGNAVPSANDQATVAHILALVDAKQRVDRLLQTTLQHRTQFATLDESVQSERASAFLRINSELIDLSGRLRYLLFDRLNAALTRYGNDVNAIRTLLAGLQQRRSGIGAVVLARRYLIPPSRQTRASIAFTTQDVGNLLSLIAQSGETELLPSVTNFVFDDATPGDLVVAGAQTIRQLGLPQEPLAGQDPTLPEPTVLADELFDRLQAVPTLRLSPNARRDRSALFTWLETLIRQGENGPSYRWGLCDVQPGDWFLMRNPSPYNLFTNLSPGLFTHVGVVTDYRGPDGIRRFVLVDLPERGTRMQTTNFDTFVQRSLHYLVLRHDDPQVATAMAAAARSVIGNPTQFDLNFRTDRIESLRGVPLAGKKIHTYCAGLLLLCAMQSTAPRDSLFPLSEHPAAGNTVENLAKLGLTFGDNFVSPTGAIFSPRLKIVGSRQSMYDPTREIQEAIYDHFARQLVDRKLTPAPDLYQSVRLKLAETAKTNPLLAQAMASAAKVSSEVDLVAAAKAAAVVETLDQFAYDARDGFNGAKAAIRSGSESQLRAQGFDAASLEAIRAYRQRHSQLYQSWQSRQLAPRQLRIELVKFYIELGQKRLDERFFSVAD